VVTASLLDVGKQRETTMTCCISALASSCLTT